jgi:hypothetical protein
MRITLLAFPYKVKSMVPGWKGWRLSTYGLVIKEPCECDNEKGCIAAGYEDEADVCKCMEIPSHTHTWVGHLGSRPVFFP